MLPAKEFPEAFGLLFGFRWGRQRSSIMGFSRRNTGQVQVLCAFTICLSCKHNYIYMLTWQQIYFNKAGPPTTSEKRSHFTLQLRQPMQKTLELTTTTQLRDFLIYSEWETLYKLTGKYHQKGFIADGLKSRIRDNWTETPRARNSRETSFQQWFRAAIPNFSCEIQYSFNPSSP